MIKRGLARLDMLAEHRMLDRCTGYTVNDLATTFGWILGAEALIRESL